MISFGASGCWVTSQTVRCTHPVNTDVLYVKKKQPVYSADHLVAFFQRCLKGLSPGGGLIVVKENVADTGAVFDEQDSSVTR